MRSWSFLSKMTLFGFILCTLPVIFIGVFSYYTSYNEIQAHVNRGSMQLLKQTNANVEQVLTTVEHTLNQVINSSVLRKAMTSTLSVHDFMIYDELRSELRHMQSFDTKLEDVILLNRQQNWLVKNSGLYRFNDYPYADQLGAYIDVQGDSAWRLNPNQWFYTEESASTASCKNSISLMKKLPTNSLSKFGLAIANIPTCSLYNFLHYELEDSDPVMILDEQHRILLHPDSELIGLHAKDTGYLDDRLFMQSSGQFRATIDHKPHNVTYYRSDFNGWIYLSATSIASLTKQSGKIGMYTLYVCLIMLLITMALAWLGSRRMYSPIETLLNQIGERLPDTRKHRGNEFQVIGEHVSHLFQSKSRLELELRQHLSQVLTLYLLRAYQGNVKKHEIASKLAQFGYGSQLASWHSMAVITLQIDSLEQTRYEKRDLELLLFAVENIIEETIEPEHRLAPVIMDTTIVILIGSGAPDQNASAFNIYLHTLTEQLQNQILHYLNLSVSIGISQPFDKPDALAIAYREGLEALRHRIKLGEGIIIQYEQLSSEKLKPSLNLNYPYQVESELIDTIKLGEKERAKELLGQLLQGIFAVEKSTPQEYQVPLSRLLNNLLFMMQESGISLNQIYHAKGSLYEELFQLQIVLEIEDWFWSTLIHPLVRTYRDRQDEQYHNLSEKVIDLIHRLYDTDLSLSECAAQLHYNANYLSSVFRKETNYSFSEYLTAYRFKMAKKWLAETDMPIKDIASKLRYNNSQNFIRSFRKQEQITPGQYREMHQRDS